MGGKKKDIISDDALLLHEQNTSLMYNEVRHKCGNETKLHILYQVYIYCCEACNSYLIYLMAEYSLSIVGMVFQSEVEAKLMLNSP